MKLLTLNMNMFNYDILESFPDYLAEINPDLAIIQECRYNRISELAKQYMIHLPNNFTEKSIDNRIHYTLVLSKKDKKFQRKDIKKPNKYDYSYLKIAGENVNHNLLAVHLPCREKGQEDDFDRLLNTIKESNADIICGDFNANSRNPNENYELICDLLKNHNYVDLWNEGIKTHVAKIIDYNGKSQEAKSGLFYRTYAGNTHIDYILAKKNLCELKSISIDNRTLAFTDHCGIIADLTINKIQ